VFPQPEVGFTERYAHEIEYNPDLNHVRPGLVLGSRREDQSHLAVDWGRNVETDNVKDCSHKGGHARE
jgi:hypothetical protein